MELKFDDASLFYKRIVQLFDEVGYKKQSNPHHLRFLEITRRIVRSTLHTFAMS